MSEALLEQIHAYSGPGLYVVAIAMMLAEGLYLAARRWPVNHWGGAVSMISGGLAFGPMLLLGKLGYVAAMFWFYEHRLLELGAGPAAWVVAFLAYDCMFYTVHRLGHEIRLLWCIHGVHHTVDEMRLTSAIRGSVFDVFYIPLFYVWIPILGVHPLILLSAEAFSRLWGVYTHVNEKFVGRQPLLERVLITPSAHRVHHGRNEGYLDTNYAQLFSFWDRLLGTWRSETEPPEYGIRSPIRNNHLGEAQFRLFADLWRDVCSARTWSDALGYIFRRPGWEPKGR